MKIYKIFKNLFAITGFLVVTLLLILIAVRLTMRKDQFNYFVKTSIVFVKQELQDESFSKSYEPNIWKKYFTHLKLIYKINNKAEKEHLFSEKIYDFTVNFPNYSMMHSLFHEIFIRKIYNFEATTNSPFIIDAGSNIGMSIIFFKMVYPKSKIIGFEPSKKYFEILQNNIKNNNLNNVQLFNKALSNKEEEAKFYDLGATIGTLKSECESDQFEMIKTDLLSNYITQKVDLLKMDIEGAETDVIQDLFEKNKLSLIDQIIMEYHYTPGKSKLSDILAMLEQTGFVYVIKNNVPTPFVKNNSQQYFLIYAYKQCFVQ